MPKINGQIWIDARAPYNLKYRYNNTNFTVSVKDTYNIDGLDFHTGNLIAIGSSGFKLASFPEDINNIEGLAYINEGKMTIVNSGEFTILKSDFENCFYDDLEMSDFSKGDKIYWLTTRYNDDVSTSVGLLTIYQPNGFKESKTFNTSEYSYNISYDNLPIVAVVKDVDVEGEKITLNVNIGSFDSTLEWSWPKKTNDTSNNHNINCGLLPSGNNNVIVNHGLFNGKNNCFNELNIVSIDSDDNEYQSLSKSLNDYNLGSTTITIKSIESLRYSISGVVHYKISRG